MVTGRTIIIRSVSPSGQEGGEGHDGVGLRQIILCHGYGLNFLES